MTEPEIATNKQYYWTYKSPEQSDWHCQIVDQITVNPRKGKEPNAFHRWMQELVFGVKWTKKSSTKAES